MPIASSVELGTTYRHLLQERSIAENRFAEETLGIANEMAEAIVDGGGMTLHAEQFALAMHGVANYSPRSARPENLYESAENSDPLLLDYDRIEESVSRLWLGGTVLMARGCGPRFAMQSTRLHFPPSGVYGDGSHPLRFLLEKRQDPNIRYEKLLYEGRVILPVVEIDVSKEDSTPTPSSVQLAAASRRTTSLEISDYRWRYGKLTTPILLGWTVGKKAILSAGMSDHRSFEDDRNYVNLVASAATRLADSLGDFAEEDWSDEYQRQFDD